MRNIYRIGCICGSLAASFPADSVNLTSAEGKPPARQQAIMYQYCNEDHMLNSRYDCNCLKEEYGKALEVQGTTASPFNLLLRIKERCKSKTAYAKSMYDACMNKSMMDRIERLGKPPRAYCHCFAEQMSNFYIQSPGKWSHANMEMSNQKAIAECDRIVQ